MQALWGIFIPVGGRQDWWLPWRHLIVVIGLKLGEVVWGQHGGLKIIVDPQNTIAISF